MAGRSLRLRSLVALLAIAAVTLPALAQDAQPVTGWRAYGGAGIPTTWKISGDVISHTPGGGDLVSVASFDNFELRKRVEDAQRWRRYMFGMAEDVLGQVLDGGARDRPGSELANVEMQMVLL